MLPSDWNKPSPLDPIGLEKSKLIDHELLRSRIQNLRQRARCLLLSSANDDDLRERVARGFADGKLNCKGKSGEITSISLGKKLPKVIQFIEPDVLIYLLSLPRDLDSQESSKRLEATLDGLRACLAQLGVSKNCAVRFILVEDRTDSLGSSSPFSSSSGLGTEPKTETPQNISKSRTAQETSLRAVISSTESHPFSVDFVFEPSTSNDEKLHDVLCESIVQAIDELLESTTKLLPESSSETVVPNARALALSSPVWLRRALE